MNNPQTQFHQRRAPTRSSRFTFPHSVREAHTVYARVLASSAIISSARLLTQYHTSTTAPRFLAHALLTYVLLPDVERETAAVPAAISPESSVRNRQTNM